MNVLDLTNYRGYKITEHPQGKRCITVDGKNLDVPNNLNVFIEIDRVIDQEKTQIRQLIKNAISSGRLLIEDIVAGLGVVCDI